jgi:surface antigen
MRRGRRARGRFVAVTAGQMLWAASAVAQSGTFGWSPNEPRLTQEDRRMLWDSGGTLNERASAQSGTAQSWSNPRSGNSGQVTLERVFRSNGMPCHALRYSIAIRSDPAPQIYDLNWCRTPDGQWKLLN